MFYLVWLELLKRDIFFVFEVCSISWTLSECSFIVERILDFLPLKDLGGGTSFEWFSFLGLCGWSSRCSLSGSCFCSRRCRSSSCSRRIFCRFCLNVKKCWGQRDCEICALFAQIWAPPCAPITLLTKFLLRSEQKMSELELSQKVPSVCKFFVSASRLRGPERCSK